MELESMALMFGAVGLVGYFCSKILHMFDNYLDNLSDDNLKDFREYDWYCPCVGFKIKQTCRHFPY